MLQRTENVYLNRVCNIRSAKFFYCILRALLCEHYVAFNQRWSPQGHPWPRGHPRGHILKSLALALKPQVLGLGLEALGPRNLPCPRLEDSTIF